MGGKAAIERATWKSERQRSYFPSLNHSRSEIYLERQGQGQGGLDGGHQTGGQQTRRVIYQAFS